MIRPPKKSLSQNFLIDANIVRKIVLLAEVAPGDAVLEIGPGPGALTAALLTAGARVFAIEIDRTLAQELHRLQNGRLNIYESDFLKFPMDRLPKNIKVVANLPYHITTPILEKLFASSFSSIVVMVQKEVARRMQAKAGTKEFGSLTLFVEFHSQVMGSFDVSANCFYPKPKVDSTVIRLDAREIPTVNPFPLVRPAFQHRRKMLTSALPYPKEVVRQALSAIGVRVDARPEMLPLSQWIALTERLREFFPQESP